MRKFLSIILYLSFLILSQSCNTNHENLSGSPDGNSDQDHLQETSKTPWQLYQSLDKLSNETLLIQRAAAYSVAQLKPDNFDAKSINEREGYVKQVLEANNFKEIFDMFNRMSPVHRVGAGAFRGIDGLERFLSLEILQLSGSDIFTLDDAQLISRLTVNRFPRGVDPIKTILYVAHTAKLKAAIADAMTYKFDAPAECGGGKKSSSNMPDATACLNKIKPPASADNVVKFLESFFKIKYQGINYYVDKEVGTDKFVFTALGINSGDYGNINIVIKRDMLLDKSTWTTPVAATFFYRNTHGAHHGRPWISEHNNWDDRAKLVYERNKIKNSNPGLLALTLAVDFLGRTVACQPAHQTDRPASGYMVAVNKIDICKSNTSFAEISAENVRNYMLKSNSHEIPEVHLPVMGLEVIEKIVMPEINRNRLKNEIVNIPVDKIIGVVGGTSKESFDAALEISAPFP